MKRSSIFIILAVMLAFAVAAIAGNYRLPVDGTGKFPVQGYGPQTNTAKKTTAIYKAKGSYKNFTTAGLAAIKCSIRTPASTSAAGTATAAKVRFGGYSTGGESDHYPTAEDTFWNPPAKIGFHNYSGILDIHCTKQP